MDLSKLTQLELLDLRMKVNQEIESFSYRDKIKVFRVFLQFDGTKYFYQKENAIKYLLEMIENDEVYDKNDNEVKLSVGYYSKAECEQWCEDKPNKDFSKRCHNIPISQSETCFGDNGGKICNECKDWH